MAHHDEYIVIWARSDWSKYQQASFCSQQSPIAVEQKFLIRKWTDSLQKLTTYTTSGQCMTTYCFEKTFEGCFEHTPGAVCVGIIFKERLKNFRTKRFIHPPTPRAISDVPTLAL